MKPTARILIGKLGLLSLKWSLISYEATEEILMSNTSLDTRTPGNNHFANPVRPIVAPYTA